MVSSRAARTRLATSVSSSIALLHRQVQRAGNQQPLDFGSPLADLERLRIAVEAGNGVFLHEPVAAEDLGSDPCGRNGGLGGIQPGDGRCPLQLGRRTAMITKTGRRVDQQPGGMGHYVKIGDRESDRLIPPDWGAEGLPLQCVAPGKIAARSNATKRKCRDGDPPVVQSRQDFFFNDTATTEKM